MIRMKQASFQQSKTKPKQKAYAAANVSVTNIVPSGGVVKWRFS